MKKFLILFSIFVISLSACEVQNNGVALITSPSLTSRPSETLPVHPSPNPTSTTAFNAAVNNNGMEFISALVAGNKEIVADIISYPLDIALKDGNIQIPEPAAFLEIYDIIFNPEWISQFGELLETGITYTGLTRATISVKDGSVEFNTEGKIFAVFNSSTSILLLHLTVTPTVTPDPNSCFQTAMTQYDMNMCASQQSQSVINKLQVLISELIRNSTSVQIEYLLVAQADWEKAANTFCIWASSGNEGGTVHGMMYSDCLVQQYKQRINELRMFLCDDLGAFGECEASWKYKER